MIREHFDMFSFSLIVLMFASNVYFRLKYFRVFFMVCRKLIRLVKQYGVRKWAQIAEKLAGRAGKQCRERWHNHLRPDIKVQLCSL